MEEEFKPKSDNDPESPDFPFVDQDYLKDSDDSYEDDDNRFAGLNSHGNDIFGRSGW